MYITTDLYLTAYLNAKEFDIISVNTERSKCSFEFEDTKELKKEIINYINKKGSIEPLRLVNSIKNIKVLTYNY